MSTTPTNKSQLPYMEIGNWSDTKIARIVAIRKTGIGIRR